MFAHSPITRRLTSTWRGTKEAPRQGSGSRPDPPPVLHKTWRGTPSCRRPGRTDRAEEQHGRRETQDRHFRLPDINTQISD